MPSADALLAGPRGRGLCLAVAQTLDEQIGSAWTEAALSVGNRQLMDQLAKLLVGLDPTTVQNWSDPLAFADPIERTVSNAMGWQEPDAYDTIAGQAPIIAALRPIATAVLMAPGAAWWADPVDTAALRCVTTFERRNKSWPAVEPTLGDTSERLLRWRAWVNQSAGTWWSPPHLSGLISTTRPLGWLGAIELVWHEDTMGERDALLWPMSTLRTPRVYEINGPDDWIDLVARYPLDVTSSRRHDWHLVTSQDSTWLIPDYAAVAADWDAVHVSVAGYLTTATRQLTIADQGASLLVGWDPDQTWWLTDILQVAGPVEHWHRPDSTAPILWHHSNELATGSP